MPVETDGDEILTLFFVMKKIEMMRFFADNYLLLILLLFFLMKAVDQNIIKR